MGALSALSAAFSPALKLLAGLLSMLHLSGGGSVDGGAHFSL